MSIVLVLLLAGCESSGTDPVPAGTGECTAKLLFRGRIYDSNSLLSEDRDEPVGQQIGRGEWTDCDHTPLGDTTNVFELTGVDHATAVVVPAGKHKSGKSKFTVMVPPNPG